MDEISIKLYVHHAQYYETDQMAIIHHSNYIRWMEEARLDFMSQCGVPYKELEDMGIIIPVLSVSCQYRSMVRFDDCVTIGVKVVRYSGVKMDLEYAFTNTKTGELTTTGTSSHCFLNREYRPMSLKKDFPEIDAQFRKMRML